MIDSPDAVIDEQSCKMRCAAQVQRAIHNSIPRQASCELDRVTIEDSPLAAVEGPKLLNVLRCASANAMHYTSLPGRHIVSLVMSPK